MKRFLFVFLLVIGAGFGVAQDSPDGMRVVDDLSFGMSVEAFCEAVRSGVCEVQDQAEYQIPDGMFASPASGPVEAHQRVVTYELFGDEVVTSYFGFETRNSAWFYKDRLYFLHMSFDDDASDGDRAAVCDAMKQTYGVSELPVELPDRTLDCSRFDGIDASYHPIEQEIEDVLTAQHQERVNQHLDSF